MVRTPLLHEHVMRGFMVSKMGREKVFKDTELEALFDEDSCQSQNQLARSVGVT